MYAKYQYEPYPSPNFGKMLKKPYLPHIVLLTPQGTFWTVLPVPYWSTPTFYPVFPYCIRTPYSRCAAYYTIHMVKCTCAPNDRTLCCYLYCTPPTHPFTAHLMCLLSRHVRLLGTLYTAFIHRTLGSLQPFSPWLAARDTPHCCRSPVLFFRPLVNNRPVRENNFFFVIF